MFKTIEHTLTADVAKDGTFTVAYPDQTDADSFQHSDGHYMIALQARRDYPENINLTFGASDITVTHLDATTLPAGTPVRIQLELAGKAENEVADGVPISDLRGTTMLTPLLINFGSPVVADDDAFIDAATSTELPNNSTKSYTFPGTASPTDNAAGQSGVLDWPRNVTAAQVGTSVAGTVTVTGTDIHGEALVETLTFAGSVSNESEVGLKAFSAITQIDIASATDMTSITLNVGFGNVLGFPVFVPDLAYVRSVMVDGDPVAFGNSGYVRVPFNIPATEYAAGTSMWKAAPVSGDIVGLEVVVDVLTAGAGAVTVEIQTVAVAGLSCVIPDAQAAGVRVTDEITPVASSRIEEGEAIEIVSDGVPTGGAVSGFVVIKPDNLDDADVVAGVQTKATAATGDVRGTIDFKQDLAAATGFAVELAVPEVSKRLGHQYAG